MLIIFTMLWTAIFTSSHGKYIELLSEKQKQQFLDKIARKIMESDDNSKRGHKFSREITIDMLNSNTAHMRKRRADDNSSKKESYSDGNIQVRNETFASNKTDSSSSSEELGVAISELKRHNYDASLYANTTDYKIGKLIEDSTHKQETIILFNVQTNESKPVKSLPSTKYQDPESLTKNLNHSERFTNHKDTTTTKFTNLNIERIPFTESTTCNTTKSGDESIKFNRQIENVTNITAEGILLNAHIDSTTANVIDKVESPVQKSDSVYKYAENNTYKIGSIKTSIYLTNISTKSLKPDAPYQEGNDTITNSANTNATFKKSIFIDLNKYALHSSKALLKILSTTSLPSSNLLYIGNRPSTSREEKNLKKIVKPSTKLQYKLEKQPMEIKKYDATTEKKTSLGSYQVYEIDWPDSLENPLFVKSAETIKNSPFLVPTYKYSPNYAFYNPFNRLNVHTARKNSENHDKLEVKNYTNGIKATMYILTGVKNDTNKIKSDTFPLTDVKNNINYNSNDSELRKFGVYKKEPKFYVQEPPPKARLSPEDQEYNMDFHHLVKDKEHEHPHDDKYKFRNNVLNTVKEILSLTDETDVFPTLDILQQMDLKLMRRNDDVTISIHLKALNDLIEQESIALKRYDWLATTVQIQSALAKLFQLIQNLSESKPIHPADVEILKYIIFLHNFLSDIKGANNMKRDVVKLVRLLSRINRVWLHLRTLLPELTAGDGLNSLYQFLLETKNALYDLHEAITQISKVTKFKQQNWFENLKQLYLTSNEKHLRELLLHISVARMVDLIEHSCENGLEDDYIRFITTHKNETKTTLKEMVFVSNILDDIKSSLE